MRIEDLLERWKNKLSAYLRNKGEDRFTTLSSNDFLLNKIAVLKFQDGSFAEFKYPLIIEAPEYNELGVFTEHCGYHIFHNESVILTIKSQ